MINPQAEQAAIGTVLIHPHLAGDLVLSLTPEHFQSDKYKNLFGCIRKLYLDGTPIDVVTLHNEVRRRKLDMPVEELGELAAGTTGNLQAYIEQIKEQYRMVRLMGLVDRLNNAYKKNIPSANILTGLQKELNEVSKDIAPDSGTVKDATGAYRKDKENSMRYDTNIPKLDDIINKGLKRGQIMVLAGESGAGKSYLAENIALYQALIGFNVLFFSTELAKAELFRRAVLMFQAFNDIPDFDTAVEQIQQLTNIKLYSEIHTSDGILTEIKRQNLIEKVDLVVVDHLQDIEIPEAETEYETIRRACMELKDSCIKDEYALILASQLKSGNTGKFEFHGARKIRQIATVTLVIKREEVNGREETALIVDKNRHGRVGVVPVRLEFPEGIFYQV